ncbi:MAG: TIR domain-containing protein [Candidatus Hydrogenedentes bacterium]|nr:TIR domain-containing protein [Candidatus Hydrogenedentota bacterium]
MKVFISHSSTDKWIARRISTDLVGYGVETFLDAKDIKTGDPIDETIRTHLSACDHLLLLLTPASVKSHWVLMEVGGAMALGKRIVPILMHLGANDIPDPISKHLARDINDIEAYYAEVSVGSSKKAQPVLEKAEKMQKSASPLSVGDTVRLPPSAQPKADRPGRKFHINWIEPMNAHVGKLARITQVDDDQSAHLDIDGGTAWWAFEWLEKVK